MVHVNAFRAALVAQFYWPEPLGTATYTTDLARGMVNTQDWALSVITGEPYYPNFEKHPHYLQRVPKEIVDGVEVNRVWTHVPRPTSAVSRLVSEVNFVVQSIIALLRRRIRRYPLVVSFAPGVAAIIVGHLVRARNGRHMSIVHDISSALAGSTGLAPGKRMQALLQRIEAGALNRSDVVVALSPQMAKVLRSMGVTTPIEIVPLWIRQPVLDGPLPLPQGPPRVLYSGSLARKHGLHRLVSLAQRLEQSMPEARLRIQGEGPLLQELERLVVSRGVGTVEFRALTPEGELRQSLAAGRVHVVPQEPGSADFAVPSKVLTSLACGRPVVTTARPGSPLHDLSIRCSAVTCVDPEDSDALHRAVLDRLIDDELYSREARVACTFVRDHHQRRPLIEALLELLVDKPASLKADPTNNPA